MSNEYAFEGTDLKILVELTATDFDMDQDDWRVGIKCRNKIIKVIPKEEAIRGDDGWFVTVKAEEMKPGDIEVVGYADIPDEDFDTNIRREVEKDSLLRYEKV